MNELYFKFTNKIQGENDRDPKFHTFIIPFSKVDCVKITCESPLAYEIGVMGHGIESNAEQQPEAQYGAWLRWLRGEQLC